MKLIINIDEDDYEMCKIANEATSVRVRVSDNLRYAIANGTPLDDIKAEIEQLNPVDYGSMFSYESHNGARDMKNDIINILDKHISRKDGE